MPLAISCPFCKREASSLLCNEWILGMLPETYPIIEFYKPSELEVLLMDTLIEKYDINWVNTGGLIPRMIKDGRLIKPLHARIDWSYSL